MGRTLRWSRQAVHYSLVSTLDFTQQSASSPALVPIIIIPRHTASTYSQLSTLYTLSNFHHHSSTSLPISFYLLHTSLPPHLPTLTDDHHCFLHLLFSSSLSPSLPSPSHQLRTVLVFGLPPPPVRKRRKRKETNETRRDAHSGLCCSTISSTDPRISFHIIGVNTTEKVSLLPASLRPSTSVNTSQLQSTPVHLSISPSLNQSSLRLVLRRPDWSNSTVRLCALLCFALLCFALPGLASLSLPAYLPYFTLLFF